MNTESKKRGKGRKAVAPQVTRFDRFRPVEVVEFRPLVENDKYRCIYFPDEPEQGYQAVGVAMVKKTNGAHEYRIVVKTMVPRPRKGAPNNMEIEEGAPAMLLDEWIDCRWYSEDNEAYNDDEVA